MLHSLTCSVALLASICSLLLLLLLQHETLLLLLHCCLLLLLVLLLLRSLLLRRSLCGRLLLCGGLAVAPAQRPGVQGILAVHPGDVPVLQQLCQVQLLLLVCSMRPPFTVVAVTSSQMGCIQMRTGSFDIQTRGWSASDCECPNAGRRLIPYLRQQPCELPSWR